MSRDRRLARHRRFVTASSAIVVVLLLVACGSGSSGAGGSNTATTVDVAMLGAKDQATGDPIKIGVVVDGKADAMDSTSVLAAAEATADYANEHLGGINGHRIDVESCTTGGTHSGATTCAVQLTRAKVAVAIVPMSSQDGAVVKGLEGSGIPTVAFTTVNPTIVANPDAFVLGNPFAAIAAPAAVAEERGLDKVGLVVIDVPATTGPISALAAPIYERAGIEFDLINVSPQVADMTPQIQQAIDADNDLLVIGGTEQFTISALKAIQQLGYDGDVMLAGVSSAPAVAAAVPGVLDGVQVISPVSSDSNDPDVQLYHAVMATYAEGIEEIGVTPNGFVAMLGFVRAVTGADDAVDAASTKAAMASMGKAEDLPMGAGIAYQCGAKPIAFAPSVCSADVLVGTLDADGQGHDFQTIDVASYLIGG